MTGPQGGTRGHGTNHAVIRCKLRSGSQTADIGIPSDRRHNSRASEVSPSDRTEDATELQAKNLSIMRIQRRSCRHRRPTVSKAPNDFSIDADIALIKEVLAIITAPTCEHAAETTTTSPAAKAERQARLTTKVLKIQELALQITSPCAQELFDVLSVQSLADYEEANAVKFARAA